MLPPVCGVCYVELLVQLALIAQAQNGVGHAPQVDETGGVGLVVIALAEGDDVLRVQTDGRGDAGGARIYSAVPSGCDGDSGRGGSL